VGRYLPLTEVASGETVSVAEIHGGHGVHRRLSALGIRPGVMVRKVSGSFVGGPVVLQAGATQTALGRGICAKIMVEVPE